MGRTTFKGAVFLAVLIASLGNASSGLGADNFQKGITIAPFVVYVPGVTHLSGELEQIVVSVYEKKLGSMGRFVVNPLPASLRSEFHGKSKKDIREYDKMNTNVRDFLFGPLSNVIEDSAFMRALRLEDEVSSRSFLEEKAKEQSVSRDELNVVLDCSYIGVPYFTKVELEYPKGSVKIDLNGGIAWFKINLGNTRYPIEFVDTVGSFGSAHIALAKERPNRSETAQLACQSSVEGITEWLVDKVRNLEPFKIKGDVILVEGGLITFDKGATHDVRLDDKFYVVEKVGSPSGRIEERKVGYVRVTGHRKDKLRSGNQASARVIKKSRRILPGMNVVEHPKTELDFRFGVSRFSAEVTSGKLYYKNKLYVEFPRPSKIEFLMVRFIAGEGLIGRGMGISQLFAGFSVMGGFNKMPEEILFDGSPQSSQLFLTGGVDAYLAKKVYYGPFAIRIDAGGMIVLARRSYRFSQANDLGLTSMEHNILLGAGFVGGGAEIAVGIDTNLGIAVTNLFSKPSSSWNFSAGGENDNVDPDERDLKPLVQLSSLEVRIYLTHSIL